MDEGRAVIVDALAEQVRALAAAGPDGITLETFTITVEGHTDDAPIHQPRFPSNWELSSQRATAVVRHLIDQGVDARNLQGIAYAHTRPVAPNRDGAGQPITSNRAKNRRVVIRIER